MIFSKNIKVTLFMVLILTLVFSIMVAAGDEEGKWLKIDQENENIVYDGIWDTVESESYYKGSEKFTSKSLYTSLEFTFEGTAIKWFGKKGITNGKADVYLDGEKVASNLDSYSEKNEPQSVIFTKEGLTEGEHTIKIKPTGDKNKNSIGTFIVVDYFAIQPTLDRAVNISESFIDEAIIGKPGIGDKLISYYPEKDINQFKNEVTKGKNLLNNEDNTFKDRKEQVDNILKQKAELESKLVPIVFADESNNEREALLVQGAPMWLPGKEGKAIYFNNDLIDIPEVGIKGDEITIEFWHYGVTTKNQAYTIHGKDEDGKKQVNIHLTWSNGNAYWDSGNDGSGCDRIAVGVKDKIMDWKHWAFVKNANSGKMEIYCDGELLKEDSNKNKSIKEVVKLTIGSGHKGVIDELKIWSVAKNKKQILLDSINIPSGDEDSLLGYWSFDDIK